MRIAILVDGGFFLKRYRLIVPGGKTHTPREVAKNFFTQMLKHVDKNEHEKLYRILFYDCSPGDVGATNPITGKYVDFGKTHVAKFRTDFHKELTRLRKVALRLGELRETRRWVIQPSVADQLLKKKKRIKDLREDDVFYDFKQKGVDIKIGLDIASLALKRMVDRIVLVSGDSDFVPATKFARREGIDLVLDPMWNHIKPSLLEHIDGLRSTFDKPQWMQRKSKPTL